MRERKRESERRRVRRSEFDLEECREGIKIYKYYIHSNIITVSQLRRDRSKRRENRYDITYYYRYGWLGYLTRYVKRIRFRRACDHRHVCVTHYNICDIIMRSYIVLNRL